jgi:ABC-2 type transport system ATP-binding protein
MPEPVIDARNLVKRFDDVVAVDDVTFAVEGGSVTGLLGGNGAGKTTTLSILLGLLLPTAGSVRIFGVDMLRDRYSVLPRLNFSSPYVDLPKRLTVAENLRVYALLYGLDDVPAQLARVCEAFDLSAFMERPFANLSAGQRTRVALAKALINEPELLLLDEPTASLDPDTSDWVRGYLESYRDRTGATIVLASHNMAEVERMCDDVIMMRLGRIVDRDTPAALVGRYGRANLEEVFLDIARGRGARSADAPGDAEGIAT